jgi:hypothetical protein
MVPKPAQYLLRFDDLCPTVSVARWQRLLPLIYQFGLRPILAVVPDNRDHTLRFSPPNPDFWAQMRDLEAAGATIALHGYRHLCQSEGRSLLPLHHHTEFAGMPETTQREWIHVGLEILRGHGLQPKMWVAPRHGFDQNTLRALRSEGIRVLSDGFARVPFHRGGITWIPQQLWGPLEKSKGLWTICIHSNSTHGSQVEELHDFLSAHSAQFTSVDRVLTEFIPQTLGPVERLHETWALWKARTSRIRRGWKHRSRSSRTV